LAARRAPYAVIRQSFVAVNRQPVSVKLQIQLFRVGHHRYYQGLGDPACGSAGSAPLDQLQPGLYAELLEVERIRVNRLAVVHYGNVPEEVIIRCCRAYRLRRNITRVRVNHRLRLVVKKHVALVRVGRHRSGGQGVQRPARTKGAVAGCSGIDDFPRGSGKVNFSHRGACPRPHLDFPTRGGFGGSVQLVRLARGGHRKAAGNAVAVDGHFFPVGVAGCNVLDSDQIRQSA